MPRNERSRWNAAVTDSARNDLKTAIAAWYGSPALSRDAFRARFLDPSTTDQTVDLLRSAARGLVEGRSYADLSQSGKDLAAAAQQVGVNRWPRFLGSASAHAVEAVSRGEVPGVTKVSADTATDIVGLIVLGLLAIMYATRQSTPPGREQSFAGAAGPTIMRQDETKKADQRAAQPAPGVEGNDSSTADLAKAGDASLSEDRKK